MRGRLSIVAGLVVGVVAAGLLLGGIIAFAPDAPARTNPTPSVPAAAPSSTSASGPASAAPLASASASAATSSAAFHVGQPAPALVVPKVGGGTIDLASLKGKPVWVDFMATWCPPCQDGFPLMNGFAARYADTGLGAVAAFANGLKATFPMGLDSDGKTAAAWDALALPVHFWIDTDGIVRDGALGGIGPDVMARGLETILPGVDVTP
jgi:thiol-disulfide isomerase/thioredoxin